MDIKGDGLHLFKGYRPFLPHTHHQTVPWMKRCVSDMCRGVGMVYQDTKLRLQLMLSGHFSVRDILDMWKSHCHALPQQHVAQSGS